MRRTDEILIAMVNVKKVLRSQRKLNYFDVNFHDDDVFDSGDPSGFFRYHQIAMVALKFLNADAKSIQQNT